VLAHAAAGAAAAAVPCSSCCSRRARIDGWMLAAPAQHCRGGQGPGSRRRSPTVGTKALCSGEWGTERWWSALWRVWTVPSTTSWRGVTAEFDRALGGCQPFGTHPRRRLATSRHAFDSCLHVVITENRLRRADCFSSGICRGHWPLWLLYRSRSLSPRAGYCIAASVTTDRLESGLQRWQNDNSTLAVCIKRRVTCAGGLWPFDARRVERWASVPRRRRRRSACRWSAAAAWRPAAAERTENHPTTSTPCRPDRWRRRRRTTAGLSTSFTRNGWPMSAAYQGDGGCSYIAFADALIIDY